MEPRHKNEAAVNTPFLVSLSNLGGNVINEVVLAWLKAGRSREEIAMEHLEPHLRAEITESTGR